MINVLKKILPIIILLCMTGLIIVLAICGRDKYLYNYFKAIKKESYLAHALGGINKKDYTNSLEALENSYKSGIKLYEVDVKLTSDDRLICVHGFKEDDYVNLFELEYPGQNTELSYDEFMNLKIRGKYTPLDIESFIRFMKQHEDIYVMVDIGKRNKEYTKKVYEIIVKVANNDESILNRLIVGGQTTQMIQAVKEVYNFKLINLYWSYKENRTDKKIDTKEEFLKYCINNSITSLSTSEKAFNENVSAIKYFRDNGLYVYLFTINDREQAIEYLKSVDVVGTDFINIKNN